MVCDILFINDYSAEFDCVNCFLKATISHIKLCTGLFSCVKQIKRIASTKARKRPKKPTKDHHL